MCGMRYGKHTPMPECFPNLRTQDTALADEARRSGSHGILHREMLELNRELDDVRSRVFNCQSLPSIREVFSEVRHEESRRKVMLREYLTSRPEASTLDLSSGKMIGSAKEREGLYYFDEANVRGQCPPTICNSASSPRGKWTFVMAELLAV
ncbi:hypothetical protein CK203_114377 [Vitis vinifera]|uniref:Uncharacterized protein n=1 Tax=Vitis vinifera TaxID=29760 RepID=A0A438FEK8_VITVI|nr:hypothetical protein CK203_114377 [Vitis vinifera]